MSEKTTSMDLSGLKVTTSMADRAWCDPCVYAASPLSREDYLCDFFVITGRPRGCKAGAGCRRREFRKKKTP